MGKQRHWALAKTREEAIIYPRSEVFCKGI